MVGVAMGNKYVVGIDVGGTSIKLAFLTLEGEPVSKWEIPTNKADNGKYIINEIAESVREKQVELHIESDQLVAAGVGAPGPIDTEKGLLFEAVNIGWPDRFPIGDLVKEQLQLPVAVDNDANVAALGEMWKGAGKGAKDLICITIGTGVGGGTIVDGDIVHGDRGAAGEIGHFNVEINGRSCNCGNHGCLETVASATGIVRTAKEKLETFTGQSVLKDLHEQSKEITAKDIFDAAREQDAFAQEVVDHLAHYLGRSLAQISTVTNPEKFVIGGGVSRAGNLLLDPISQYFKQYAFKTMELHTDIVLAELGNDAGIVGAAWLALNKAK